MYSNWASRLDGDTASQGFTSNETGISSRGAVWSTYDAAKASVVETAYAQKIPQGGSVPVFDIQFQYRQDTGEWVGNYWHYTTAMKSTTIAKW